MSKELQLTRGYVAIVDDEDFHRVSKFKWYPRIKKNRKTIYVMRNSVPRSGNPVFLHNEIRPAVAGFLVDHRNGNGLDNRKENLRYATSQQSAWNRSKYKSGTKSKFKGVSKPPGCVRWRARISKGGKMEDIGFFDSELEAAKAFDAAARALHGDFARLNLL